MVPAYVARSSSGRHETEKIIIVCHILSVALLLRWLPCRL
jgi:hypothetical protein